MTTATAIRIELSRTALNDVFDAYLHYSEAKKNNIKSGDTFTVTETIVGTSITVETTYKAIEYITWRNDINREFAGFGLEVVEIESNEIETATDEITDDNVEDYLEGLDEALDTDDFHTMKCTVCGHEDFTTRCPNCTGGTMKVAIYNRETKTATFVN